MTEALMARVHAEIRKYVDTDEIRDVRRCWVNIGYCETCCDWLEAVEYSYLHPVRGWVGAHHVTDLPTSDWEQLPESDNYYDPFGDPE